MLIFGYDTDDGFCNITPVTKNVFVGLFGFYPHARSEDLENFFDKEIGVKSISVADYSDSQNGLIEVYNVCDRRTFDSGRVMTIPFSSEAEAKLFIEDKIRSSDYVNKSLFNEIFFIDADDFLRALSRMQKSENAEKLAEAVVNNEYHAFKETLMLKYSDNPHVLKHLRSR